MDKTNTLTNVPALRRRARRHLGDGAVTPGYSADRETVLRLLDAALATELVCVLRYRRHHFMAKGIPSKGIAGEFLAHSNEEQGHADRIAGRIVQLGGAPDFSPNGLAARSHAEYVAGEALLDMVKEDLVAERIAIDSYRDFITLLGDKDPTTRRLLESILAVEEGHADELARLLLEATPYVRQSTDDALHAADNVPALNAREESDEHERRLSDHRGSGLHGAGTRP